MHVKKVTFIALRSAIHDLAIALGVTVEMVLDDWVALARLPLESGHVKDVNYPSEYSIKCRIYPAAILTSSRTI